jgi:hypothetical protein
MVTVRQRNDDEVVFPSERRFATLITIGVLFAVNVVFYIVWFA